MRKHKWATDACHGNVQKKKKIKKEREREKVGKGKKKKKIHESFRLLGRYNQVCGLEIGPPYIILKKW